MFHRHFLFRGTFLVLTLFIFNRSGAQTLRLVASERDIPALDALMRDFTPAPRRLGADTLVLSAQDSAALFAAAQFWLSHLQKNAYLAASYDSVERHNDSSFTARLYLGPPRYWLPLRPAIPESGRWLDAAGFREKLFTAKLSRPRKEEK